MALNSDDGTADNPLACTASGKPLAESHRDSRPKHSFKWNADDSMLGGVSSGRGSANNPAGKMEAGQDRANRSYRSTNSLPLRSDMISTANVEQVSGDSNKSAAVSSNLKSDGKNNPRVQFDANKKPDGEADGNGRSSSMSVRRQNSRNLREKVQLSIELWKERMKKKNPPLPTLGSPPALVIPNHRRYPKDRKRKKLNTVPSPRKSKSPIRDDSDRKTIKKSPEKAKAPEQDEKQTINIPVEKVVMKVMTEIHTMQKITQVEPSLPPNIMPEIPENQTITLSIIEEEKRPLTDQNDLVLTLPSVSRDESVSSLDSNLLSPSTVLIEKQGASESGIFEADDLDLKSTEASQKPVNIILQNMLEMELQGMEESERNVHIKRRQRQEIYALNRIMTSMELAQFEYFCREHNIPVSV